MTRGDETAAAHIPTQPSTSDAPDDYVDTDTAVDAAPAADPGPAADAVPEAQAAAEGSGLDDRSKEILAFERRWWRQAGSKEQAIRDTFGLSATRYYQMLNAMP